MIFTILLYFVQPAGETFTLAEQQQATQSITQAADWWHARRGDVFSVQTQGVIAQGDRTAAAGDGTIVVFVIDSKQPLPCGAVLALGCSTWRTVYLLNTDRPWIPAHELGHALYLLPDLTEGVDIMNPWAARTAYEQDTIGCISLAALGTPCSRTYLPLVH